MVTQQPTRWVVNVRLVMLTAACSLIVSLAAYFWHARQLRRNSALFLDRATSAEAGRNYAKAAENLFLYLKLQPDDPAARIRLAANFAQSARSPAEKARAVELLAAAIGLAPDQTAHRCYHMALVLELGDYSTAVARADELLQEQPENVIALRVYALALHALWRLNSLGSLAAVTEALDRASRADPANVVLATELARIYRTQLHEPNEPVRQQLADAVMDRLVTSSPRKAEAHLGRHAYRMEFGLADAEVDLAMAAAADEKKLDPSVQFAVAMRALQSQDWETAKGSFKRVISVDSRSPQGYVGLAQALRGEGEDQRAVDTLTTGLRQVGADNLEINLQLAAAYIKAGRREEAQITLDKLERNVLRVPGRDHSEFLSRLYMLQVQARLAAGDVRGAIPRLKQVLSREQAETDSKRQVAMKAEVYSELGNCYRALQQWDQAALAFQEAVELQPQLALARLDAARAWEAAGHLDEAVRHFAGGLAIKGAPSSAWLDYCSALFRQQTALPARKRNWQVFQDALHIARQLLPNETSLTMLEAEYEAEQGHVKLALQLFHTLEEGTLSTPEIASRLALKYERLGQHSDADRLLEKLQSRPESRDTLAVLMSAVDLLVARQQYDQAERLLAAKSSHFSDDERRIAQFRLANVLLAQGKSDRAKWALVELSKGEPPDIRAVQLLLELAIDDGDHKVAEHWERQLRELEGPAGAQWRYYRAERLVRQAVKIDQSNSIARLLSEASQLQEEIERLRPAWAPGYLLKAEIRQLAPDRDDDAIIDAYLHAMRLGERRPPVYEQLILALYRQQRLGEAHGYLTELAEAGRLSPAMASLAMMIDAQQGNFGRAIETARRELLRDPDGAQSHLQLGQLLAMEQTSANAQRQSALVEAEAELKRATELAPNDSATWSALLALYVGVRRADDARALLESLKRDSKLGTEDTKEFFAHAHELLGELEQAAMYHREAVAASPKSARTQLAAGRFFFRRDPQLAEHCLRRALTLDATNDVARRLLATLLADRGGDAQDLDQVWSLLDNHKNGEPRDATDRRIEALLQLRRGGTANRQHARKTLETLAAEGEQATPIDRLMLARLYEHDGQMGAAREQLQTLVNRENPNPMHLATYADHLLRAGRGQEATATLQQLAAALPESQSPLTLSLRVRWMKDQNLESEIPQLLESFLKTNLANAASEAERARILIFVADLCSSVDLPKAAENCYRKALSLDSTTYAQVAHWLSRQGRVMEAVETCVKAAQFDRSAQPAITLSRIMLETTSQDDARRLAEPILHRALLEHGDQVELLLSLGTLRLVEGKNNEAIRLLRLALERDPRSLDAMNNLAMALAQDPGSQKEAIACLDRALKIAGANPQLLDSKGWILLKQQKPEEAEALFLEALALPPGDPRHRFHLALAYQSQGKLPEARRAIERAREDKLPIGLLAPEERTELVKLEKALH